MAAKGPRKQSARLRVLKDERADRMPGEVPAVASDPPPHLCDAARAKWVQMAEGVAMTRARAELTAVYCEAFALKRKAAAELAAAPVAVVCGTGGLKPHPALRTLKDCDAMMLASLAAIARLDAVAAVEPEADPLAEFLASRKA